MSQALESVRREILEKSQKQEKQIKEQGEIIAAQEVRIAQMDERVLKLELAADQQNPTNEDVNRTTGSIAKDSGNTRTIQYCHQLKNTQVLQLAPFHKRRTSSSSQVVIEPPAPESP